MAMDWGSYKYLYPNATYTDWLLSLPMRTPAGEELLRLEREQPGIYERATGTAAQKTWTAPVMGAGGPPISPSARSVAEASRQAGQFDLMGRFGQMKEALMAGAARRGLYRSPLATRAVTQAGEQFARAMIPSDVQREINIARGESAEQQLRRAEAAQKYQAQMAELQRQQEKEGAGQAEVAKFIGTGSEMLPSQQIGAGGGSYAPQSMQNILGIGKKKPTEKKSTKKTPTDWGPVETSYRF